MWVLQNASQNKTRNGKSNDSPVIWVVVTFIVKYSLQWWTFQWARFSFSLLAGLTTRWGNFLQY